MVVDLVVDAPVIALARDWLASYQVRAWSEDTCNEVPDDDDDDDAADEDVETENYVDDSGSDDDCSDC